MCDPPSSLTKKRILVHFDPQKCVMCRGLVSPPPIPLPKLQEGFQTLPTDPTAVDDPNYENITVTLRKQDHPKGSHSPPKSKGKQPCSPHPTGGPVGGVAGTEGSTGGQDQWGRVWLRRGLWDSGGGSSVGGHGADCVGGREGLVMVMVDR